MSLATRCNSCGTTFRVSEEQLRVSEGWVRCGRCEAVFNAAEHLIEIDASPAGAWPERTPEPSQPFRDVPANTGQALDQWQEDPSGAEDPSQTTDLGTSYPQDDGPHGADAAFDWRREPSLSSDRDDTGDWSSRTAVAHEAGQAALPAEPDESPKPAPAKRRLLARDASGQEDAADTQFMRRAQARERWKQPAVVQGLALMTALLCLMLAMQWAHHHRDILAARWPAGKGALDAWCVVAGCEIKPPQRIEDVVIDSASLTQIGRNSSAVKLSVNLRNKGSLLLAVPSVDLRLTDTQGKLVLRRALSPDDFQEPVQSLEAGREQTLQMVFQVKDLAYSGYHVEVFYP